MSKMILSDAFVSLDGNDISDHVSSVTINYSADMVENTCMGDAAKTRLAGLKDFSVDLDIKNNYAASEIDSILFDLVGAAATTILIKPKNEAVSTSNPQYSGSVLVESYSPISGSVGENAESSVTLPGSGALSRATS